MNKLILALLAALLTCAGLSAQTIDVNNVRAKDQFSLGSGAGRATVTSIVTLIDGSSTHSQLGSALAMYNAIQAKTVARDTTLKGNGTVGSPLGLNQQGATTNQVLKWNGTQWAPASDVGANITAGGGITIFGTPPNITITNTGDISATNEAQTLSAGGTTSPTVTLSQVTGTGGGTITFAGGGNTTLSRTSNTITITTTGDPDAADDLTTSTSFAGDVTGIWNALTVERLRGVAVSATAPTTSQYLKYNGTAWAPANIVGSDLPTLTSSMMSDFAEAAQDATFPNVVAGANITVSYNDAANTLTITGGAGGSGGISTLNGLTAGTQSFATSTTGTDFTISSTTATHTFNLPSASATNRGLLTAADWTTFNNSIDGSGTAGQVAYFSGGTAITGSNNLWFTGTNFGIGTNSPAQKIHTTGSGEQYWRLESTSNGYSGIVFKNGTGSENRMYFNNSSDGGNGTFVMTSGGGGGGLRKKLAVAGGVSIGSSYVSTDISVNNSLIVEGNTGFGTASPATTLHVAGLSPLIVDVNQYASNISFRSTSTNPANRGFGILFRDADPSIGAISRNLFYKNGTFVFAGNGAGFGPVSGSKMMHVNGSLTVGTGTAYTDTTGSWLTNGLMVEGSVAIGRTSAGAKVDVQSTGNTSGSSAFTVRNGSGTVYFNLRDDGAGQLTGSTGTATTITGRDGSGWISNVSLGATLALTTGTLNLAQQSATTGQALVWSGTAWAPATVTSTNIYNTNGSLTGARTVTLGSNALVLVTNTTTDAAYTGLVSQTYNNSATTNPYLTGRDHLGTDRFYIVGAGTTNYLRSQNGDIGLQANSSGFKTLLWTGAGGLVFPTATLASPSSGTLWVNGSYDINYQKSGVTRTVANVEDDLTGAGITVTSGTWILAGAVRTVLADANTAAVAITAGANMAEGRDYYVACRNNGTNAVTVNAGSGYNLLQEGNIAFTTSATLTAQKHYILRRIGTNIYIND